MIASLQNKDEAFESDYVQVFMGGKFRIIGKIRTTGELKQTFRDWLKEVDGWGDDNLEIESVDMMRDYIDVTLKEGVVE